MDRTTEQPTRLHEHVPSGVSLSRLADKAVGTDLVLMALLASHPQRDEVIKQINEMAGELAELRGNPEPDLLLRQVKLLTQQLEQDDADVNP